MRTAKHNPPGQSLPSACQAAHVQPAPLPSPTYSTTTPIFSLVPPDSETSPFAAVVASSGPMAKSNPFRFSTKWWDDETGLGWWGYRWYGESRWTSRDPIGERGGLNLFVLSANSGVSGYDALGDAGCVISYEYFVRPENMALPDSRGITQGRSQFDHRWKPCDKLSEKLSDYAPTCHVTVQYRNGIDIDALPPWRSQRTTRQHEEVHVQNYEAYFQGVDAEYRAWENKCVCSPCADAVADYLFEKRWWWRVRRDLQDAILDCEDYPPGAEKQERCADESAMREMWILAHANVSSAEQRMERACAP